MASAPADTPQHLRPAAPRARPRELEDGLNLHVYHPLSARLARALVPTGVSPNAVSVVGGLLICAAAYFYTRMAWPTGALIGFACHLLWHVVDGADGDLARMTGKSSPTGEMIDGICDYVGHIILYVALAAMLSHTIGGWAWFWASAAGLSHVLQTNHSESQRRTYLWWAYGVPWLKNAEASGDAIFAERRSWIGAGLGAIAFGYIRLSAAMTPGGATVDAALRAAAGDPRRTAQIRRLVRRASVRSLRLQKVLGANPKTILVGLAMLAGSPLYFFLVEVVALNLLLIGSVWYHNRVASRLDRALARTAARAAPAR
jgi:hypothetical protein